MLPDMNVLKRLTNFLTRLGELFVAKTDEQGRRRAVASAIILILTIALYWWLYGLTSIVCCLRHGWEKHR